MQLVDLELRQIAFLLEVLQAFLSQLVVSQLKHLLVLEVLRVALSREAHRMPIALVVLCQDGGRPGVQLHVDSVRGGRIRKV